MSNVECRRNDETRITKNARLSLGHSSVIRHSSFRLPRGSPAKAGVSSFPASHQELAGLHYLFAVEPDVEVAANAVDVRFGNPIRASVLGIGMTEGDVDAGNFFVL